MPNTVKGVEIDPVREKLVELIAQVQDEGCEYSNCLDRYDKPNFIENSALADHLIANGFRLEEKQAIENKRQETSDWISVKERLPKDNSNVLACLWIGEESRIYPAFYAHGAWWDRVFNTTATNTTTHWMPLPEPPKGE